MTTYTENCSRSIAGHPAGALDLLTQIFRQWMQNEQFNSRGAQERRQLQEMSDGMLQDIGVSRAEAEAEAIQTELPLRRSGC